MSSEMKKLTIHTRSQNYIPDTNTAKQRRGRSRRLRIRTRLTFHERLLRNSFLAFSVLLGVLALGNLQQPWAQKAVQGIEQALTMKVDLDDSLGELTFVRNLMPESALVFFNLSGSSELTVPVQGELTHLYSAAQPWLMFNSEPGASVCAPADGIITAISNLSDGSIGVLIDHGEGKESVIAGLSNVNLQTGDGVIRGGSIGNAALSIYYELRSGGNPCDPTEKMGL